MVLPDSVFQHACAAMCKPVDHMYMAPRWGAEGYQRVAPLHVTQQNVVYELDPAALEEAPRY